MPRTEIFHPMTVHFPVALLVFAYALFIASRIARNDALMRVSAWALAAGALGAAAAVITGIVAEKIAPHNDAAHELLEIHAPLGVTVTVISFALLAFGLAVRWNFNRITGALFAVVFTVMAALLGLTGYYGGTMVYEHGMAVSPKTLCAESAAGGHNKGHQHGARSHGEKHEH